MFNLPFFYIVIKKFLSVVASGAGVIVALNPNGDIVLSPPNLTLQRTPPHPAS
jgi:hypothetical protein